MCVEHMTKVTANDSHRHDDIADTLADAVKIALIDKQLQLFDDNTTSSEVLSNLAQTFNRRLAARTQRR